MMTEIPEQTAQGAQAVAQYSAQALRTRVQRKRAARPLDGGRNPENLAFCHLILTVQRGIAGEKKVPGVGTFSNQSVKNQSFMPTVKKDGSAAEVCGLNGADLYGFTVENGWGHARPARFKTDRGILFQQGEDKVSGFGMERSGHQSCIFAGEREGWR